MDHRDPYVSDAPRGARGGFDVISVGNWLLTLVLLAIPLLSLIHI